MSKANTKQFVTSKVIGRLFQNDQFEDWWESEPREIPFFDNKKIEITFMDLVPADDNTFIEEADRALESFFSKSNTDRNELSDLIYKHSIDFVEAVGWEDEDEYLRDLKDKNEIWNYVYPQQILVSRRNRRDKDIYITIACECEWEEEHGLQLIFRQGRKLTRISDQDGHLTDSDAFDTPDSEDSLLSQFNSDSIRELPTTKEGNGSDSVNLNNNSDNRRLPWWRRLWS